MFAFLALHSCTHIKEALEYVFKKLDANGDKKKISSSELGAMTKSLGQHMS